MAETSEREQRTPGEPIAANELPDSVTFFVTRSERKRVLKALRAIDADRSRALLRVLGVGGDRGETDA